MSDDVIPLDEIGKIETVKVYNQAYVDKLEKENAELKELLQRKEMLLTSAEITAHNEGADKIALLKENKELKKENQKWKDEWQEQVQKENDESYARTLQTIQLTKAKEIIKTLAADLSMYSGNYQKELLEAKQFLSEVKE